MADDIAEDVDYNDFDYRTNRDHLDATGVELLEAHEAQVGWHISPNTSEDSQLRWWETSAVIINRMIGTGVYTTPTALILKTRNVGISLMFWFLGGIATLCATLMYTEYGLTIPRVLDLRNGERVCLPSNGGELNYMEYLLDRPKFFAAFLFGVPFILIGNSAANSISFANNFLQLCSVQPTSASVFGLAIFAIGLACAVHATYRTMGIYANTIFAAFKIGFLLVILVAGFVGIGSKYSTEVTDHEGTFNKYCSAPSNENNNFNNAFESINGVAANSDIATAYLQVVFSYGGFQQANYILSDVLEPRKTFMRTSLQTVGTVCVLYILVAVAFLGTVPVKHIFDPAAADCQGDWQIGSEFFKITMNQRKIYNCFLMISSFGNIVVTTFTAARVKQEIAKTGILGNLAPFFGNNYNVVAIISRWIGRARHGFATHRTPAAALLLHFINSLILLAAVWRILVGPDGYTTLTSMYSYTIDSFFAAFLGAGMLCMRFPRSHKSEDSWDNISAVRWAPLSAIAAFIALVMNTFPLIVVFFGLEQSDDQERTEAKTTAGVGLGLLALGIISWLLFNGLWVRDRIFRVERAPVLYTDASTGEIRQAFDNFRIVWEDPQPSDPSIESYHFHLKPIRRRRGDDSDAPVI